jgi:hypothetical protein
MKEKIKGWLRPIGLVQVFIIVSYSVYFDKELSSFTWAWIMVITTFFYGERGIQNVVNTFKGKQP